jgi:predicted phosphodiesterase
MTSLFQASENQNSGDNYIPQNSYPHHLSDKRLQNDEESPETTKYRKRRMNKTNFLQEIKKKETNSSSPNSEVSSLIDSFFPTSSNISTLLASLTNKSFSQTSSSSTPSYSSSKKYSPLIQHYYPQPLFPYSFNPMHIHPSQSLHSFSSTTTSNTDDDMKGTTGNNKREIFRFPHSALMVELEYDYLAEDSLSAIQLLPFLSRKKPHDYLPKWLKAMKKWQLLTHPCFDSFHASTESSRIKYPRMLSELKIQCQQHRARVIAIGDVHGCIEEVIELLQKLQLLPGDLVLFLGDLVAKGPYSAAVLELAVDIGAWSVKGNHDCVVVNHYLDRVSTMSKKHGKGSIISSQQKQEQEQEHHQQQQTAKSLLAGDTMDEHFIDESSSSSSSYSSSSSSHSNTAAASISGVQNIKSQHEWLAVKLRCEEMQWLASLPYSIRSNDLGALFVHAGFNPQLSLEEQEPNVMMTIRSLDAQSKPTQKCLFDKGWASQWEGPLRVYYGHDAVRGYQTYEHAICTDSGCVYGGNLTAVVFPEEEIITIPAKKKYLKQK